MNTHRSLPRILAVLCAASTFVLYSATAMIVGPYGPDTETLHLWHLDEAAVPSADAAAGGTNLVTLVNGATLGNGSYPGFGNALNTLDGGQGSGAAAGTRDALISPSTAANPGNISFTYADPVTGAFTMEAIVWIGFNPSTNLGTAANGGNGRNSPLEILSCESTANPSRIFQFRILPVGMVPATGQPVAAVPLVTFENVRQASGSQGLYAAIPTTGPNAIVSNNWYHVAVTYNGQPNSAGNFKFYWTLLDSSRTVANEIPITSSATMLSGPLPLATAATPPVIGNEARARTANFLGLIDEVRVSKVARTPAQMLFTSPEVAIVTQPAAELFLIEGETATLSVAAGGEPPLTYQWQYGGITIPGAVTSALTLENVTFDKAGQYSVVVGNTHGSITSSNSTVRVGVAFTDLFNTGVDNTKALLPGGSSETHWELIESPDLAYPGPVPVVVTAPPGAWMANGPNSMWIAPGDGVSQAPGQYAYRTSFVLDSVNPAAAQLNGSFITDNQTVDVRLNGVSRGVTNSGALSSFSFFVFTNGFVAGLNTLEIVLTNLPGGGLNYTGLRSELRGVGLPLPASAPAIVQAPVNVTTQAQQTAVFKVGATGTGPLAYQWYHGATLLAGQTTRTLVLPNLISANSGTYTVVVANSLGSANASASLTVVTPAVLAWTGANSADWDSFTANWIDNATSASALFSPSVDVLFDSRGSASPIVNVTETVRPNSIRVNADSDYTFGGTGTIAGNVPWRKEGMGTLILDLTNNSTGPVVIQGGVLQVGNGNVTGTLGSGSVNNNAGLVFNRFDAMAVPNKISGSGALTNLGYSTLLLGSNSYSGLTVVTAGSISPRHTHALGSTASGTIVPSGGQLFVDANIDLASEPLTLSGTGPLSDGALRKGGSGTTQFGGPITIESYASIKVDGNSILRLTNAAGIVGPGTTLTLTGDTGGQGFVSGSVQLDSGALAKEGASTWTLAGGANTWANGTTITAGTLQIGDGNTDGSLPAGTVYDSGTLAFNGVNPVTFANEITGTGGVTKNGTNTLTLSGPNSYTGQTVINAGTLIPSHAGAFGNVVSNTVVAGGSATARLALQGGITLAEPLQLNARQPLPDPAGIAAHVINLAGNNALTGEIITAAGGNQFNVESAAGVLTIAGNFLPVAVTGQRFLNLQGDGNAVWSGAISNGSGIFTVVKRGNGTWTLFGANGYTGPTLVEGGELTVHGSLAQGGVAITTSGTLSGGGIIAGSVTNSAGGTLSPSSHVAGIGTLTITSNVVLQAGSRTLMQINKSNGTRDQLVGITNLAYGGTLEIVTVSGTLANGDAFKLFDASSYSGSFDTIIPASPGTGLSWNTSTLATDGTLRVSSGPDTTPLALTSTVVNNTLEISWPASHTGWTLQGQTNALNVGLSSNWQPVPNSTATNRVFLPITPGNPTVFYRLFYQKP